MTKSIIKTITIKNSKKIKHYEVKSKKNESDFWLQKC